MVVAVDYQPGERLAVVQQIPFRNRDWSIRIEGTVLRYEQAKTAASFAHAQDDRLWLDRLTLRRDDGDLTTLVLDQYTQIERLTPAKPVMPGASEAPPAPGAPAAG